MKKKSLTRNVILLIASIVKNLTKADKNLEAAAKAVAKACEQASMTTIYSELHKLVPGISFHEFKRLRALGNGSMLPDIFRCKHNHRGRILYIAPRDQARVVRGVPVYNGPDKPAIKLTINEMTPAQFYCVVDEDGKLRNVAAQATYLGTLKNRKHARWHIDLDTGVVKITSVGLLDDKDLKAIEWAKKQWQKNQSR